MLNPSRSPMQSIALHAFREERPGWRWRGLYDATWPQYRSWYLRPGTGKRPTVSEAEHALLRYMPELHPTWGTPRRDDWPRCDDSGHADALEHAGLCSSLLAGGGEFRSESTDSQLRLSPRSIRTSGDVDAVFRPRGDRNQRLPLGPAGWDEFRWAGDLADLRRRQGQRIRVGIPWSCAICSKSRIPSRMPSLRFREFQSRCPTT